MPQSNSSTCSSVASGDRTSNNSNLNLITGYQQPQTTLSNQGNAVAGLANALYSNYSNGQTRASSYSQPEQTILHLGQTLETVPYMMNNFANMVKVETIKNADFSEPTISPIR
jgi:hypothetical protein